MIIKVVIVFVGIVCICVVALLMAKLNFKGNQTSVDGENVGTKSISEEVKALRNEIEMSKSQNSLNEVIETGKIAGTGIFTLMSTYDKQTNIIEMVTFFLLLIISSLSVKSKVFNVIYYIFVLVWGVITLDNVDRIIEMISSEIPPAAYQTPEHHVIVWMLYLLVVLLYFSLNKLKKI